MCREIHEVNSQNAYQHVHCFLPIIEQWSFIVLYLDNNPGETKMQQRFTQETPGIFRICSIYLACLLFVHLRKILEMSEIYRGTHKMILRKDSLVLPSCYLSVLPQKDNRKQKSLLSRLLRTAFLLLRKIPAN